MNWTNDQKAQIFNEVCRGEQPECPIDGAVLKTRVDRRLADSFSVVASCPRCGERMTLKQEADSLAGRFRPWTEAEKAALVDDYYRQYAVTCPLDGTPLNPSDIGAGGVMMRCFRCGNLHQHSA